MQFFTNEPPMLLDEYLFIIVSFRRAALAQVLPSAEA